MRRWRDESSDKLKNFTVIHDFEGVTPEMFGWYFMNRDSESYRLWHPAHIGLQWEKKSPIWVQHGWVGKNQWKNGCLSDAQGTPKNKKVANLNIVLDTEQAPRLYILIETESPGCQRDARYNHVYFPHSFPG